MKPKVVVFIVLALVVCLAGVFAVQNFVTTSKSVSRHSFDNVDSSYYNVEQEVNLALERLKTSSDKADIISNADSSQRYVAITFDGLTSETVIHRILDLLKQYDAKATFFVDGVQTVENPQIVVDIISAGQKIGNYTLAGKANMENIPVEKVIQDICRAQKIIKVATDQQPRMIKLNDTQYSDQLLKIVKTCGLDSVVKSNAFVDVQEMHGLAAARDFVESISPGSIISIKLNNVDIILDEEGKTDLRPAIDKQPGLKELAADGDFKDNETVAAVENLLNALQTAGYATVYVEKFPRSNDYFSSLQITPAASVINNEHSMASFLVKIAACIGDEFVSLFSSRKAYAAPSPSKQAREIKIIPTIQPAVAFTFAGLSNQFVVEDTMKKLHLLDIKATFFVTELEMKRYPQLIRSIVANGHEVGVSVAPKENEPALEAHNRIMSARNMLKNTFGVDTTLIKQPWGAVSSNMKQAVWSAGGRLIGQSVNVVQSKHKDYTSAEHVLDEIFGKATFSLGRGQIVHFRMDYYTNRQLLGELVALIKQRKVDNIAYRTFYDNPETNPVNDSQYTIISVGRMLESSRFLYQYPVTADRVLPQLRDDRMALNFERRNLVAEASKRYIGHPDVTYDDRMLGFSRMELRRFDTSGLVQTQDNVIFLTLDDWGNDAAVNKLLYVLRKHNATAAFFILTNNMLHNPNLLRAIAMEGHEIGSHSDLHQPMVARDAKTRKQVGGQDYEQYRQDVTLSFQKLRDVVGDITINDKPALTRFFRPPTLAISKMGVEVLLGNGYSHIISGSCSTHDYEAKNVAELVRTMKDGIYFKNGQIRKGAILIMHMSDSSAYTATAIDILLTANAEKADNDPSKFIVGRLSDYITEDYAQIITKNRRVR